MEETTEKKNGNTEGFRWAVVAIAGLSTFLTGCFAGRRSPTAGTEPVDPFATPTDQTAATATPTNTPTDYPTVMCYTPPITYTPPTDTPTYTSTHTITSTPTLGSPTNTFTNTQTYPMPTCYTYTSTFSPTPTYTRTYTPTSSITALCYTPTASPTPTNIVHIKRERKTLIASLHERGILSDSFSSRAKDLLKG